jgi:hypothetical protein
MIFVYRSMGLLWSFIIVFSVYVKAQVPTTQDCLGAIQVCDYIYVEDYTASGEGNYPYEIPTSQSCPNHCMDGEKNTRWYQWTVIQSGDLMLTITPATSTDDYDWAVFNLTDYSCEDIYNNPIQMMVSCNAAGGPGYQGVTGISSLNGGVIDCNGEGNTNKWNVNLPVYEGESYVLVVSDWTQTPGGYTLDFSNSTAVIFDDLKPFIDHVGNDELTACGSNELNIYFNETVKCSSIQASDFLLEGPGGPYVVDSIYGENCDIGGENERNYTLYFTPPMYQSGDYNLIIKTFSFISDPCNNYALPDTIGFVIELDSPLALAGDDIDIAYGGTASLQGSGDGGSGDYSFHWEPAELLDDPDIENPTTVNLTVSTEFTLSVSDNVSSCIGEDTMWVNIVGGPLTVSATVDKDVICHDEIVNLFANPEGGSENYSYTWTSDPPGFSSTQQNPSDFPTQDITYYVEVTDGFTTLTADVSVNVNPKPLAEAGEDIDIQLGTTTSLNGTASGGSGDYSYQWEPASWLEQNDIQNPTTLLLPQTTMFSLLVTDNNTQCQSETDNMFVIVSSDELSANPYADPAEVCYGKSTFVTAIASGGGGGYEYEWTSEPPGITSNESGFTVSPLVSTTYKLHLTDQFGNEFDGSITVKVNPLPIVDLVPDQYPTSGEDTILACVRDTVLLDAGFDSDPFGTTYFWKTDNYENRTLVIATNGTWIDFQTHSVVVTHATTGCVDSGSITVIFDFNECQISVPEQFADLNDALGIIPNPNSGTFNLKFNDNIHDLDLKIFNIRGKLMFEKFLKGSYNKGSNYLIESGIQNSGVYMLVLKTKGGYIIKRLIIQ